MTPFTGCFSSTCRNIYVWKGTSRTFSFTKNFHLPSHLVLVWYLDKIRELFIQVKNRIKTYLDLKNWTKPSFEEKPALGRSLHLGEYLKESFFELWTWLDNTHEAVPIFCTDVRTLSWNMIMSAHIYSVFIYSVLCTPI